MTIQEAINQTAKKLSCDFIEEPLIEARVIVCFILDFDTHQYILSKNKQISAECLAKINEIAESRLTGRSLAAILGSKCFYEDNFIVSDDVLIPRPETELLVDYILQNTDNYPKKILEIGVGSGIITITLAKHRKNWSFTAIDISQKAVEIANLNAKNILNNQQNLHIFQQDFFTFNTDEQYDIIVSNPPYIPTAETTNLLTSKSISDPRISLDGGKDGLDFYKSIFDFAQTHLTYNGLICVEHGYDQRNGLQTLSTKAGFNSQCYKDYADLDRFTVCKK